MKVHQWKLTEYLSGGHVGNPSLIGQMPWWLSYPPHCIVYLMNEFMRSSFMSRNSLANESETIQDRLCFCDRFVLFPHSETLLLLVSSMVSSYTARSCFEIFIFFSLYKSPFPRCTSLSSFPSCFVSRCQVIPFNFIWKVKQLAVTMHNIAPLYRLGTSNMIYRGCPGGVWRVRVKVIENVFLLPSVHTEKWIITVRSPLPKCWVCQDLYQTAMKKNDALSRRKMFASFRRKSPCLLRTLLALSKYHFRYVYFRSGVFLSVC